MHPVLHRSAGLLAALLLAAPAAEAAPQFEGRIVYEIREGRRAPVPLTYFITDGRVRMEMKSGDRANETFASIVDFEKKEMIILMPSEKMYMSMAVDVAEIVDEIMEKDSSPDFEKTGATEVIAGHECEQYIHRERRETTELWVTKGLGRYFGAATGGGMRPGQRRQLSAWEREVMEQGLFPLRMITRDSRGNEKSRMEATEVSREKLDAALFRPPADFKKFELPNVRDLLRGGGN
jgi:hypothetical protein